MSTDTPKKPLEGKIDTLLEKRDSYFSAKLSEDDDAAATGALADFQLAKDDLEAYMDQQPFMTVLKKLKMAGWFRE